jgi:hypothetical protein
MRSSGDRNVIADALKWVGRHRSNPRTLWEDVSSGRMA